MRTEDWLKEQQEIAYKTIYNGFLNDQINHAYLLSGSPGSPLKEVALFIAQSLVCEKPSPLACEECLSCMRIKNKSYVDFQFINEAGININKDVIEQLQEDFSLTALEEKGRKIYIIHLIEKANPTAMNRLLKFLEEPEDDIYGILTTENISKVLPTITSRCQVIRLKKRPATELEAELNEEGLSKDDAYILSTFNNSKEEALEVYEQKNYNAIKDLAYQSFEVLFNDPLNINYYIQTEIEPVLNERGDCALYLNILEVYLKELFYKRIDRLLEKPFTINKIAEKSLKIPEIMEEVMLAEGRLSYNTNIPLLLDQLYYQIAKKGGLI